MTNLPVKLYLTIILIVIVLSSHAETLNNATVHSLEFNTNANSSKAVFKIRFFGLFPSYVDPTVCDGYKEFRLNPEAYYFDEIYSLLLSAKLSNQKVTATVSGTAPNSCILDGIKLQPAD